MIFYVFQGATPTNDLQRADWAALKQALNAVPKPGAGIRVRVGDPGPATGGLHWSGRDPGWKLDVEMTARSEEYMAALLAAVPASVSSGLGGVTTAIVVSDVTFNAEGPAAVLPPVSRIREALAPQPSPEPPQSDDGLLLLVVLGLLAKG